MSHVQGPGPWTCPLPTRYPSRPSCARRSGATRGSFARAPGSSGWTAPRHPLGTRAGARAVELTGFDVRAFLAEDVGDGDLTTLAVIPEDARLDASLLLKERGVVCGLDVAQSVFRELD